MTPLQKTRELLGLSQLELDREAGLTKGTTNDIEKLRNLRPAIDVAIRLVQALQRRGAKGVTVEQLFASMPTRKAKTA